MRVLFVVPDFTDPPAKGYQVRALALARALGPMYVTKLVAAADDHPESCDARGRPLLRALHASESVVRGWPLQSALFDGRDTARCVARRALEWEADVVIVVTERLPWTAVALATTHPVIVDVVDDMRVHMLHRADGARGPLRIITQLIWRREAAGFKRVGFRLNASARAVIVSSPSGLARYPRAIVIGNAASPSGRPRPETRFDVAFTGNLQYEPNVRAAQEVCDRIIPAVRRSFPDVRAVIAGRHPTQTVVDACLRSGVPLLADVPDMAQLLASTRLALAPIRWTPAANLKVMEALAVGTPVLAYPEAAAQLPMPLHGVHVAAGAEQMALDAVRFLRGDLRLVPFLDQLTTWDTQARALAEVLTAATTKTSTKS